MMAEIAAVVPVVPRASGRVLPGWRSILVVMEHHWRWYRRGWRATAVSSIVQPLLFLLAFGVGFGSLVDAGGRAAASGIGGVPYLVYLAPGLLAMSAVQTAAFESTYPVLSGFKWQQIYWGMGASPLTPGHIAVGHLCWIGARMLSSGAVYVLVIVLLGGVSGFGIVVSLFCATLCGLAFSAVTMAFAASVTNEGAAFSAFFRFVLIPMTLFAGTFFPLERLPAWIRPLAWVTPLWHGVEACRDVATGTVSAVPFAGHVLVLAVYVAVGWWLAERSFAKRLVP